MAVSESERLLKESQEILAQEQKVSSKCQEELEQRAESVREAYRACFGEKDMDTAE